MTKKKVLGYSLLILFGIALGVIAALCQIDNSPIINLSRKLCIASDAFFFPGVYLFAVWLFVFFKDGGLFDFLWLSVLSIVKLIKKDYVPSSCRKAYREYKKATRQETRCLFAVLAIALVFLALAVTFMLLSIYLK